MNNYLLLYCGGSMPQDPAAQAQVMKAWDDWFKMLGEHLVDGGNPFTENTRTIVASDNSHDDHPHNASGYSVIKASSIDEAEKLAKECPVLQGGASITVYETFNAMM